MIVAHLLDHRQARKEKVSFAGPYFIAGQDLLIRADDSSITGPDTSTARSSAR
jgi:glutamate transport system substrate-binding protein